MRSLVKVVADGEGGEDHEETIATIERGWAVSPPAR
jgi:hypothetical protein